MKNSEYILKELKEIAPELSKVEKKTIDDVPASYFSSFPATMISKIREDELAVIAPTLLQQEKNNLLEVPANYFKSFPEKMLTKISLEQKPEITPEWLKPLNNILESIAHVIFKPKYSLAFAGMATMLIVGVMMFNKAEPCNDLDCRLASLTDAEINAYLNSNSDAYSDEIFETTISDGTTDAQIYKVALKDVSDAELNKAILN